MKLLRSSILESLPRRTRLTAPKRDGPGFQLWPSGPWLRAPCDPDKSKISSN